jgi:hypothetical protein
VGEIRHWPAVSSALAIAAGISALLMMSRIPAGPPLAEVGLAARKIVADLDHKPISTTFEIWNRGGRDLVLTDVSTTCGCTVAAIDPKIVEPGHSTTVHVEGIPPSAGEKLVTISIGSNQASAEPIELSLTMVSRAEPPFVADHSGPVRFGSILHTHKAAAQAIRIETYEPLGSKPWLGLTESQPATLKVRRVSSADTPLPGGIVHRLYRYESELAQTPMPGPFSGEIAFRSSDRAALPVLVLAVHGLVNLPVRSSPSSINANMNEGDDLTWLTVTLRADDPGFHLEANPDDPAGKTFEIRRDSSVGNRLVFKLRPKPPFPLPLRAEITFVTNHPEAPRVIVPVSLRASAR